MAPFTINEERYAALDFSFPFLEAGLGLLSRREVDLLEHSFLSPFSGTMWFSLICTMFFGMYPLFFFNQSWKNEGTDSLICVSKATFVITFIARLSPCEWSSVSDTVIETHFTAGNCFWYLYSTIMFQRFQLKPT